MRADVDVALSDHVFVTFEGASSSPGPTGDPATCGASCARCAQLATAALAESTRR